MQVLWDHGPCLVAEVRAQLRDDLAYTTVLTILRTLEAKGHVSHVEEGRGHRYRAKVQPRAARKSALKHLTEKLFEGSYELLFMHLVADSKLTPDQIRRMRELLEKRGDESD